MSYILNKIGFERVTILPGKSLENQTWVIILNWMTNKFKFLDVGPRKNDPVGARSFDNYRQHSPNIASPKLQIAYDGAIMRPSQSIESAV